jgi:hypothetical protein
MNIAARFLPQLGNQGLIVLGEERQTTEGDADWLNSTPTRAPFTILVDSSLASNTAEPAHTQPNTSFPTYDEVVNLTGLLENKGYERIEWKIVKVCEKSKQCE